MATAGRSVVFSGLAVAAGLAVLLLLPVPFLRSMGVGGLLILPLSIAAALTLQPALLSLLGRRVGAASQRVEGDGPWARLARTIMLRPVLFLAVGTSVLLAAAVLALSIEPTPGSFSSLASAQESTIGVRLLRDGVGVGRRPHARGRHGRSGAGRRRRGAGCGRQARRSARARPRGADRGHGRASPYVDRSGRVRVIVAGRHEYGETESRRFVERLRGDLVPAARFPVGSRRRRRRAAAGAGLPRPRLRGLPVVRARHARAGVSHPGASLPLARAASAGRAPEPVDSRGRVRAARGGLPVEADRRGARRRPVRTDRGLDSDFLFAVLFGLAMDYEVFVVTRMREAWDATGDNAYAIATGLERTGPIVTSAALIMAAAFCGFSRAPSPV